MGTGHAMGVAMSTNKKHEKRAKVSSFGPEKGSVEKRADKGVNRQAHHVAART